MFGFSYGVSLIRQSNFRMKRFRYNFSKCGRHLTRPIRGARRALPAGCRKANRFGFRRDRHKWRPQGVSWRIPPPGATLHTESKNIFSSSLSRPLHPGARFGMDHKRAICKKDFAGLDLFLALATYFWAPSRTNRTEDRKDKHGQSGRIQILRKRTGFPWSCRTRGPLGTTPLNFAAVVASPLTAM